MSGQLFIDPWESFPFLIGTFIVVFGLFSYFIKERLYLSEALLATTYGIIIGPAVLNFVNPMIWEDAERYTFQFSRIVIALQVFATGVSLPKAYLYKEWKSLSILLLPIMFSMWMIAALIIWCFLPLDFLGCLLIAACITPTDPILANSVVKGKFAEAHVPENIRNLISAESGANDGLGYPYLFFPIYLMRNSTSVAMYSWFSSIWLYQIGYSCLIGSIIGYVARKLLKYCQKKNLMDSESFLVFSLAMTIFCLGMVGVLKSDDLLACFIAGNTFTWDDYFRVETENSQLTEVVELVFNQSIFIFFGTIIPWSSFVEELAPWKLFYMAALILILRRLPVVLLLKPYTPAINTLYEAIFVGWFGPIGVGAIFYAKVTSDVLNSENEALLKSIVFPVISFMILASVLIHGLTVPFFKMTKSIDIKNIAVPIGIESMVTKLPKLRPGQILSFHRNKDGKSTSVTIAEDIEDDIKSTVSPNHSIITPYSNTLTTPLVLNNFTTNSRFNSVRTSTLIFDESGRKTSELTKVINLRNHHVLENGTQQAYIQSPLHNEYNSLNPKDSTNYGT